MTTNCMAMEYVERWGHHAQCSLDHDHDGPHWDPEGWEW